MIFIFLAIIIISISSTYIFFSNHSFNNILLNLFISIFIFLGNLSSDFEFLGSNYTNVLIIVYFFYIFLNSAISNKNESLLRFNYFDKVIFFYIIIFILGSLMVNYDYVIPKNKGNLIGYFIPIKFWLVYKIFYFLVQKKNIEQNIISIINTILFCSVISGLLSLLALLGTPVITEFYNTYWPVYAKSIAERSLEDWGRISGTMSSTNGTGSFFAIVGLLSIYIYTITKKQIYLLLLVLFSLIVILTGSFSSTIAYIIILLLLLKKTMVEDKMFTLKIIFVFVACFVIMQNLELTKFVDTRLEKVDNNSSQYSNKVLPKSVNKMLPKNLVARIGYWDKYIELLSMDTKSLLFGFGPGGTSNIASKYPNHEVPESFYFRILNESGFWGLIGFIIFYWTIFHKLKLKIYKNEGTNKNFNFLIKNLLYYFLISGIANETLFYGGNAELFSFAIFMQIRS